MVMLPVMQKSAFDLIADKCTEIQRHIERAAANLGFEVLPDGDRAVVPMYEGHAYVSYQRHHNDLSSVAYELKKALHQDLLAIVGSPSSKKKFSWRRRPQITFVAGGEGMYLAHCRALAFDAVPSSACTCGADEADFHFRDCPATSTWWCTPGLSDAADVFKGFETHYVPDAAAVLEASFNAKRLEQRSKGDEITKAHEFAYAASAFMRKHRWSLDGMCRACDAMQEEVRDGLVRICTPTRKLDENVGRAMAMPFNDGWRDRTVSSREGAMRDGR